MFTVQASNEIKYKIIVITNDETAAFAAFLFLKNSVLFQGQEIVAEQALQLAAKEGHWVVLQVNISKNIITFLRYQQF